MRKYCGHARCSHRLCKYHLYNKPINLDIPYAVKNLMFCGVCKLKNPFKIKKRDQEDAKLKCERVYKNES